MVRNEKKVYWKQTVLMIIFWAVYLTLTMAFFEKFHIVPATIPGGVLGWTVIVELPRVVLGYFVSMIFFRHK